MSERVADDQALTVSEILDLMDAIDAVALVPAARGPVLKAVLCWGVRHELFTMAGLIEAPAADETATDSVRAASGDAAPGTPAAPSSTAAEGFLPPDDARRSRDGACGTPEKLPAGPQVGPEDQAGVSPSAEPASEVGQGPGGAEAYNMGADDAPVPPDAGGGTSSAEVAAPTRFARWTPEEEERAVALRLSGKTYPEMAAILGRPYRALEVKFATRLNAVCAQRRRAAAGRGAGRQAPPEPANAEPRPAAAGAPALALSPDGDPLWFRTLDANLSALGHVPPFTPAGDLALVERLARGEKIDAVAADTGIARGALKARYVALTPDGVPVGRDQERLLAVLRHRAALEMAQIGQAREAAE